MMEASIKVLNCIFILFSILKLSIQFNYHDETNYLGRFSTLIKDSYSADLPLSLKNECVNKGGGSAQIMRITNSMTSNELQQRCGLNTICTIETGVVITMNSNLNLAALEIKGSLNWTDQSQILNEQWLCAGYIAVGGGEFTMNIKNKKGFIYIKNNNLKHEKLSYRALGSYNQGKMNIIGRTLPRTWSLIITKKVARPVNSISLMHNPQEMGWQIGDRIVIAPNNFYERGSEGTAEDFFIGGFSPNNTIKLVNRNGQTVTTTKIYNSETRYYSKESFALAQAEVINLSRNIVITGDDFSHVPGQSHPSLSDDDFDKEQSDHCANYPAANRRQCTLGLHIIARDPNAKLSLQYVRIEKCGQRGVLGKYCTHLHLLQSCPECKIIGNAYEYGHQRGTVVHGTHLATVENNVYNDIRGANIYVEDGNELYNKILYNVAICPWSLYGEKKGCTVPGTDNEQSDTAVNQAGFWALGFQNYAIGNRFSNHFNGMLYQEQGFADGRQSIKGKVCNSRQKIGRMEGNTYHHHGRFGTYVLADIYPKNVGRTVESNGIPINKKDCESWLQDGSDNGSPTVLKNNVDYFNTFVGQYNAGDLQYKNHISFKNQELIYWKETKNFQDGCSSHILNSYFENGNMALPGGHGTFILENVVFKGKVSFESSHHCNIGVTGVLCMPTYLFVNMTWKGDSPKAIVKWHDAEFRGHNNGAMFTLGPEDSLNGNPLFPKGYRSIIHPHWEYLLELDNRQSCVKDSQINEPKDKYLYKNGYLGAILCKKSVRRLEIFSFGNDHRNMILELYQDKRFLSSVVLNFYSISDTKKQGYSATIIPGLGHSYKLKMQGGTPNVPSDWIIEFSDSVFGNRWEKDEIFLEVEGRNCPQILSSQHDRRWIWSGDDNLQKPGRGACSGNSDMPVIKCRSQPLLSNIEECSKCKEKACNNGFCDCGSGNCLCEPGFSGENCEIDLCLNSNCVNGVCSSKYLGGEIEATLNKCVCEDGWYGERCDEREKPTVDVTSLLPCEGICKGEFPYNCDPGVSFGYCSPSGGCLYQQNNEPNFCCYKGCENSPSNIITNPSNIITSTQSSQVNIGKNCEGKCRGSYPYGCNPDFQFGYCSSSGGCHYQQNNDPNFCCFKGCDNSPSNIITNPSNIITSTSNIITSTSTQSPENNIGKNCDGKCRGSYPYGCNPDFQFGYCSSSGGCNYQQNNDPNFCCFKGCNNSPTNIVTSTQSPQVNIGKNCDGKCRGSYPYGCNPDFQYGYCNGSGGCHYQQNNDPNFCCFKGC